MCIRQATLRSYVPYTKQNCNSGVLNEKDRVASKLWHLGAKWILSVGLEAGFVHSTARV